MASDPLQDLLNGPAAQGSDPLEDLLKAGSPAPAGSDPLQNLLLPEHTPDISAMGGTMPVTSRDAPSGHIEGPPPGPAIPHDDMPWPLRAAVGLEKGLGFLTGTPSEEMRGLDAVGMPADSPVHRMMQAEHFRWQSEQNQTKHQKTEMLPGSVPERSTPLMQDVWARAGLGPAEKPPELKTEAELQRDMLTAMAGGAPPVVSQATIKGPQGIELADRARAEDALSDERYPWTSKVPRHLGALGKFMAEAAVTPGKGLPGMMGKFAAAEALDPLPGEMAGAPTHPDSIGERAVHGAVMGAGIGVAGKVAHGATEVLGKSLSPTAKAVIPQAAMGAALGAGDGPETSVSDAVAFGALAALTKGRGMLDPGTRAKLEELLTKYEAETGRLEKLMEKTRPVDVEGQPVPEAKPAPAEARGDGRTVEMPRYGKAGGTVGPRERPAPLRIEDAEGNLARGVGTPEQLSSESLPASGTGPDLTPTPRPTGEGAGAANVSANKLYDRIQSLRSRMGTLGELGEAQSGRGTRFKKKGIRGDFNTRTENIRLRVARNLQTFAHEVGHHLQKHVFGIGTPRAEAFLRPFEAELAPLATAGDPLVEGFGEFNRLYFTQPAVARRAAPGFYEAYERALETNAPAVYSDVQDIREMATALEEMPRLARRAGDIQIPKKDGIITRIGRVGNKESWHRLYQKVWHNTHSVARMVSDYTSQFGKLAAKNDPSIYMDVMSRMGDAVGHRAIVEGVPKFGDPTGAPATRGLTDILEHVSPGERLNFEAYLIDRMHSALYDRGPKDREIAEGYIARDPADSITTLRDSVSEYERAHPEHKTAAEEFAEWNNAFLDYGRDAGVIDQAQYESVKSKGDFYVGLRRVLKDSKGKGSGGSVRSVPKPLKGRRSTAQYDYESPISQALERAAVFPRLIHRAYAQRQVVELIRDMEGASKWGVKLDRPQRATEVSMKEVIDALKKQFNIDVDPAALKDRFGESVNKGLTPEQTKEMMEDLGLPFFRPGDLLRNEDIVTYRASDGTLEQWQIKNEGLLESLNGWDRPDANFGGIGGGMLRTTKDIFTASVTMTEEFMTQNAFVDYFVRGIQTGRWNAADLPTGLYRVVANRLGTESGRAFQQYLDSGAGFSQLTRGVLSNRKKAVDDLLNMGMRERMRRENLMDLPGRTVNGVWDFLTAGRDFMSDLSESPWRQGVFFERMRNPLRQDADPLSRTIRASHEAKEATLDFGRRGSSRFLQEYAAMVPFMRPVLQGADRAARATKDRPAQVMTAMGALTALSALNRASWSSEEWREDIYAAFPGYVKDNFWPVLSPWATEDGYLEAKEAGTLRSWSEKYLWKFRKPFEFGVLPTIIDRGIIEPMYQATDDKKKLGASMMESLEMRAGEHAEKVGDVLKEGLLPPYVPAALRPLWEGWTNYNRFTERPLVSQGMENRETEDQYRESTPYLYRHIGRMTGTAPLKVENWFPPGMIQKGVRFGDMKYREGIEGEPTKPAEGPLKDTPFKDLARRWTVNYPGYGSEQVDRFYEATNAVSAADASYRNYRRRGLSERAEAKLESRPWLKELAGPTRAFRGKMSILTQKARRIGDHKTMSREEKAAKLDALAFQRQMVSEQYLGFHDEVMLKYQRQESADSTPPSPPRLP